MSKSGISAMRISIVGGGATGITMLRHLAELASSKRYGQLVTAIQLFDKSGFDGGVAYRTKSDHHLLNMKASKMSILAGDAQDFLRWTRRVGLQCAGNDHLPRKVYRNYLDDVRKAAIERCRGAGISLVAEHAEVVRMRLAADHDILLTTDRGVTHTSSVAILCTGHNAPDDHYGLSASPNYVRDPYSRFGFQDHEGIEVGILGSGLTAVDSVTALASTHRFVKMTCFSRSGLFPTVQPITIPEANDAFRDALHRYVQDRAQIEADAFANKLAELLMATTGIACDLSHRDVDGDALADLERNIAEAKTCEPNVHSYLASVANVMCDAWSRMNKAEKTRFMNVYNSGWLRNRSAMPLTNAIKVRDLIRSGRLSTRARLRSVADIGGRFRATLGSGAHRDVDYVIDATGPSYRLTSPLYLDMQRQGIVTLDALGGVSCDYADSRVHDRHGNTYRNIFAVGSPTKGTHFFAGAVDINMDRAESVINSILADAEKTRSRAPVFAEPADAGLSAAVATDCPGNTTMNIRTTPDETARLADLVRRRHPSLDTMLLEPDGKYQTRTVTLSSLMREATECLARDFRHRAKEDFPTLYCAWGKCRVGSTALTNLFGVAGMPSYFQPVKVILRHALVGRAGEPWMLPSAADQPHVFSKEMAGPYVLAESLFQPLQPLIDAGYPADRLHFIMLDRDPASSLASWLEKWSDRIPEQRLIHNYVIATLNTLRVENYARRHGVPITHYVYEASKEAAQSVRILFDRLGLAARYTESAVTGWKERGQLESKSSGITFLSEPTVYTVPGLHGSDTAYRYRARKTASLSDAQLEVLERYGIHDIYRASVKACMRDLGLDAPTAARLFGACVGAAA
jgi:uncharacterized NAD(P)/FAD-binding protein YdhS